MKNNKPSLSGGGYVKLFRLLQIVLFLLVSFLLINQVYQQKQDNPPSLYTHPLNYQYDVKDIVNIVNFVYQAEKDSKVWMNKQELSLLMSYLNPNFTMLEVGSGYSTLWYSQFVKNYVSIEHDARWGAKIKKMLETAPGVRNVTYHVVPVAKWTGDGTMEEFRYYLNKVDEVSQGVKWDVVLDDGRARVPVAQRILNYLNKDSLLIIHDFWVRSYYHQVLNYYKVVAAIHEFPSIVILKPRN